MSMGKIEDRIKKMKDAIQSQAKQRALNIVERAEEEADIQRNNIIKHQKEKIDIEFAKLNQAEKTKAKIDKSSVVNKHRLMKMQQRYKFVEQLKEELKDRLRNVMSDQSKAKNITQALVVQGMLRMMEKTIQIEGTQGQRGLLQQIIPNCQARFSQILKRQTGKDTQVSLGISDYSLQNKQKNIIGGVFLRSQDGLIVCENSLDARVDLAIEQLLPEIRTWLFPKKQQPMTAQSITQGRKPSQQFTPQPQYNPNIQNNPTRISSPQTMNPQFGQPVRR